MKSKIKLTPMEQKIFNLLKQAKQRKIIADVLEMELSTVDTHLQTMRYKTDTHSLPELLKALLENEGQ